MKKETIEGNKLMAEFMGYKYFESNVHNDTGMDDVYSKVPIEIFVDDYDCKWFKDLPNPDFQSGRKKSKWNPTLKKLSWATLNFAQYIQGVLEYHSSWDWLMPVVEKIERLGYQSHINFGSLNNTFSQHTFYNECSFQYINKNTFEDGVLLFKAVDTKIKSVWLAVVEFIKFYNQNNNQ